MRSPSSAHVYPGLRRAFSRFSPSPVTDPTVRGLPAFRRRAWLDVLACSGFIGCGGDPSEGKVDPSEHLPGGDTTNTFMLGSNAFIRPAANLTPEHQSWFYAGNSLFNQAWVEAPSSTAHRDGLGPMFNARSCAACHFKDGRGRPPLDEAEAFLGILLRLSIGEGQDGAPIPHPQYGGQLQPFSNPGVPAEGRPRVTYEELTGVFADGTSYTLLRPHYEVLDPLFGPFIDTKVSPRVAPAVIGLGLLQAISDERLLELEDPDDTDANGVSGRVNRVWHQESQMLAIGRFGWKADQPTVRQQAAGAFLGDMGLTTPVFERGECSEFESECQQAIAGGDPEVEDHLFDRLVLYSETLAPPVRTNFQSPEVLEGRDLFAEMGCATCHVPRHTTSVEASLPELASQVIWPYTDLLLHDMGPELADGRPVHVASGSEWKTPPLWGLRFYQDVNGHDRLLHDGRARGVVEAILWHGGEGEAARERFRRSDAVTRAKLVAFVESL